MKRLQRKNMQSEYRTPAGSGIQHGKETDGTAEYPTGGCGRAATDEGQEPGYSAFAWKVLQAPSWPDAIPRLNQRVR